MNKRIILEPGSYGCHNMGDVAMMQVAVTRLNELWPHAQIEVVTAQPDLLSHYCPSVSPLSVNARNAWLSGRSLIDGIHRKLPARISASLQNVERQLWLRCPEVTELGVQLKAKLRHRILDSPSNFRKQLTRADLLVVSGMGGLNDAFADSAFPLLDELEFALQAGIPVFAFGQGIGPIADTALLARAGAVLPRLALISLREGYTGLPLLESLGVPQDRIFVTGDDAIEVAYDRRPLSIGSLIGINLRLAGYAGTGEAIVDKLREPLHHAARMLNSSLISVPISLHRSDSDIVSVNKLLGGQRHGPQAAIDAPEDVILQIGRCRIVVTGSYHGGVFALAQGIPIVGLVQSTYYEQKFTGLQQQFPGGCRIIDFRRPVNSGDIQNMICDLWESAEQVREPLLKAAVHQVELSRAAYQAARLLISLDASGPGSPISSREGCSRESWRTRPA
jgi:colanic acid/amylovoran biosynthesis protein